MVFYTLTLARVNESGSDKFLQKILFKKLVIIRIYFMIHKIFLGLLVWLSSLYIIDIKKQSSCFKDKSFDNT